MIALGDQLDPNAAAFDGFDPERDAVWMAEVEEETTHVPCHKLRIAVFLAAMRHSSQVGKRAPKNTRSPNASASAGEIPTTGKSPPSSFRPPR